MALGDADSGVKALCSRLFVLYVGHGVFSVYTLGIASCISSMNFGVFF